MDDTKLVIRVGAEDKARYVAWAAKAGYREVSVWARGVLSREVGAEGVPRPIRARANTSAPRSPTTYSLCSRHRKTRVTRGAQCDAACEAEWGPAAEEAW